jgi:hypothetical protein
MQRAASSLRLATTGFFSRLPGRKLHIRAISYAHLQFEWSFDEERTSRACGAARNRRSPRVNEGASRDFLDRTTRALAFVRGEFDTIDVRRILSGP